MDYLTPQRIREWRKEKFSSNSSISFLLGSALHLLESKSSDEIIKMAETIDELINVYTKEYKNPMVFVPKDTKQLEDYGSDIPMVWIGDVSDLYALLSHLDSKKLLDFKGNEVEWYELYATYALYKIAEYENELEELQKNKNVTMGEALIERCNHMSKINIDAAIASHISKYLYSVRDFFKDGEDDEKRISNNILKRKATNATDKKYAPLRQIKSKFVAYYKAHDISNRTEAARKFYRGLSDEGKKIISPTKSEEKALRTLTASLRKYQKEHQE